MLPEPNPTFKCPFCSYNGMNGLMHVRDKHPDKQYEFIEIVNRRQAEKAATLEKESKEEKVIQSVQESVATQQQIEGIRILELMGRFQTHCVDDKGRQAMENVRKILCHAAIKIRDLTPDLPERELAFRKLQEAMYYANSAIAFNYPAAMTHSRSEPCDVYANAEDVIEGT